MHADFFSILPDTFTVLSIRFCTSAAEAFDLLFSPFRGLWTSNIVDNNGCVLARKPNRNGMANAGRGAGDNRNLILQSHSEPIIGDGDQIVRREYV